MSKGIVWGAVILVVVLGLGWYSTVHYDAGRVGNGEVYSNDPPTGRSRTSGGASSEAPANQIVVLPTPSQTVVTTTTPTDPAATSTTTGQTTQPGVLSGTSNPDAVPATDSISPEPPNGMLFAGKGRYQLYRQGDITWRLDTTSGHTCIVFATDEEWKKPRVLKAGCGSR